MWEKWINAFMTTQLIEMPIYIWALARVRAQDWATLATIAFGASAITHPFVWFVFPSVVFLWKNYPLFFVVAETFAWLVEALYLKYFKVKHPWLVSLLANGMSAGFGLLRNYI